MGKTKKINYKEYYNEWAKNEMKNEEFRYIISSGKAKFINDNFLPFMKNISVIVELWCWEWHVIWNIKWNYIKYWIDISDVFLKYASQKYKDTKFINCDITKWDFLKDNKPDLIIMADFLEHIDNYKEILDLTLSASKHILIKTPIEKSLFHWIVRKLWHTWAIPWPTHQNGHLHIFSLNDRKKILKGHKIEKIMIQNLSLYEKYPNFKTMPLLNKLFTYFEYFILKISNNLHMKIWGGTYYILVEWKDVNINKSTNL